MAVRLSTQYLKKLVPPDRGQTVIYDAEREGLAIRITANHVISWVWHYKSTDGRKRRYTIGRWPEWTVEAARDEATDLRRDLRDGIDPQDQPKHEGEFFTVNDLADAYLEQHAQKNKRASSVANDESMLDAIIRPHLGALVVRQVKQADVEKLHVGLKSTPYHANRVLSLLSTMFRFAAAKGWATENPAKRPNKLNPFDGVSRYPEEARENWLTKEQLERFKAALDRYSDQEAANVLRLLILTGSRRSEVLHAEWKDIDLQRGVWVKPSHSTKQRKTEHVPLIAPALEILRAMAEKKTGPYLFPGHGHDGPRQSIKNVWKQVCKAAGLSQEHEVRGKKHLLKRWKPTIRLHDIRHTFASHLVSQGVSLHVVGKLLGHVRSETTNRYAHLNDQALRDAASGFSKVWEGSQPAPSGEAKRGSGTNQRVSKGRQGSEGAQRGPQRGKKGILGGGSGQVGQVQAGSPKAQTPPARKRLRQADRIGQKPAELISATPNVR